MELPEPIPTANHTSVLEFMLLGVTDKRWLQLLFFGVLLLTYTLTLLVAVCTLLAATLITALRYGCLQLGVAARPSLPVLPTSWWCR